MQASIHRVLGVQRLKAVWAKANDMYLGIETDLRAEDNHPDPSKAWRCAGWADQSRHKDSVIYCPADYFNLRRIVRILAPSSDDVFYDIGCGKGRVVCVLARWPLRRVVGIDVSESLCAAARKNVERLRRPKALVEIRCEDAVQTELSDGTIYFMFNPFGEVTMRAFLGNLERSLNIRPRRIKVVYYNPVFDEVLRSVGWLEPVREFKTLAGGRVAFYENVMNHVLLANP